MANKSDRIEARLEDWDGHQFILGYDYDATDFADRFKLLWKRVIAEATDDFVNFKYSADPHEQARYHLAKDFLFDEGYLIALGDQDVSLTDLADMIGWDAGDIRRNALTRSTQENAGKSFQPGAQLPIF